jgi:excisionase family DNA binding protein
VLMENWNRVTVQEAARLLGISEGAVRARIHRGTLDTEREGGTVYVRLNADDTTNERTEQSELVQTLREYNASLERQLNAERESSAELRRIVAGLVQRIPELEAPSEPRESPETATEGEAEPHPAGGPEGAQRPWWRRWFGE